jgi:hypothetical protein
MIALPLTRGFSAGNWPILLTNNNLNVARLIGMYMTLTLYGRSRQQVLLGKANFMRNRIRQRGGGSRCYKCHD